MQRHLNANPGDGKKEKRWGVCEWALEKKKGEWVREGNKCESCRA